MPIRNVRKKGGSSKKLAPSTTDQGCFVAPKRSVRRRPAPVSLSTKKQQTITQMDPFFSLYHPEEIDDELMCEEGELPPMEIRTPPRKRQRLGTQEWSIGNRPTQTIARNTRSSITSLAMDAARKTHSTAARGHDDRSSHFDGDIVRCWPPRTPISRDKVIPSSQSPADSLLSTQSLKTMRETSRSPLKERSTNDALRHIWSPENCSRVGGRKVSGRMDDDGIECLENLVVPFKLPCPSRAPASTNDQSTFAVPTLPQKSTCVVSDSEKELQTSQIAPQTEILSFDEELTSTNIPGFGTGTETQAAIAGLRSQLGSEVDNDPALDSSQPQHYNVNKTCISSSPPILSSEPSIQPTSAHGTDIGADSVSAQVELQRQSRTRKGLTSMSLKKEPKYQEDGLYNREKFEQDRYHSSSVPSSSDKTKQVFSSNPSPKRGGDYRFPNPASSAATTIPTQPLLTPPRFLHKAPAPPSQATTVDTSCCTQASSWAHPLRNPASSLPRQPPSSSAPKEGQKPSPPSASALKQPSPPPPSSLPSLPSQLEEGDLGAYNDWRNSGTLRESQILPDSLMVGSLARPSLLLGEWEGLLEEEEGEDEGEEEDVEVKEELDE